MTLSSEIPSVAFTKPKHSMYIFQKHLSDWEHNSHFDFE